MATRFGAADAHYPASRPLYVTAAGMPRTEAADLVRTMSGTARLPDALRLVDRLARAVSGDE